MNSVADLFALEVPIWQLVVRGSAIYWFLLLVGTLIAWNYLLDWATYRFALVSRFLEPRPEPLVKHGRLVRKTLQRELITADELWSKLRQQRIDDLGVIRIARLESDGQISVIRYGGEKPAGRPDASTHRPFE